MHKTIYMIISKSEINGDTSKEHIDAIVERVLTPYCGSDAEEDHYYMDWYQIGGRWAGFTGVIKGTDCYPTEEGRFAYEHFDRYDAFVNNGKFGPYVIDDIEYIPIIGAKKKDIAWDCIEKFNNAWMLRYFQIVVNEAERNALLGGEIPAGFYVENDVLYLESDVEHNALYIKGETFTENMLRRGIKFGKGIMTPDAYVDKEGKWHDDNQIWENDELMRNLIENNEDLEMAVMEKFSDGLYDYLEEQVEDEDYILVIDGHY